MGVLTLIKLQELQIFFFYTNTSVRSWKFKKFTANMGRTVILIQCKSMTLYILVFSPTHSGWALVPLFHRSFQDIFFLNAYKTDQYGACETHREQFTFKILHSKKFQLWRNWYEKYNVIAYFNVKNCYTFWTCVAFFWSCVANCTATPVIFSWRHIVCRFYYNPNRSNDLKLSPHTGL